MPPLKGTDGAVEGCEPYLVFRVRREECAIPAPLIHEIRTITNPAERGLDESAEGPFCGSITLHGQAIPVVDLARQLGHGQGGPAAKCYVIVLPLVAADGRRQNVGLIVDAISSVASISTERIAALRRDANGAMSWRIGRVRINGRFKSILDPEQMFSAGELSTVWGNLRPVEETTAAE
jgi:chemotaxis signal transduction protein